MIGVGDVVQVVRADHACWSFYLGHVFTVAYVLAPPDLHGVICRKCGQRLPAEPFALWANGMATDCMGISTVPVRWLKKFDAPLDGEGVDVPEEVTA